MRILPLLFCVGLIACQLPRPAAAMNFNLAVPYGDKPSPPQNAFLSFHSPQSADLMFITSMVSRKQPNLKFVCQSGLRSVSLKWSLHRNMVKKPFREGIAEALPANQFSIEVAPEGLPAGFYELHVTLDSGMERPDGKPVTAICTFGWNAEKMAIRETLPKDFKAFWAKAESDIAAVPLDAKQETPMQSFSRQEIAEYNLKSASLPADYDPAGHKVEEVESCKISFAGPDGGRVYAWLAKPKGAGPFPAMLVLPGAGFNARPRPLEHARHGYLAIDIQIHGQDVDLPSYPAIPGYFNDQKYEPSTDYYYYKVHQRVLQAINFLAARPDVDAKRIVVVGGSQGGRLGIVAAGLDSRIAVVVCAIPNSPNFPHLNWVAQMNGLDKLGDNPSDPKFKDRPLFDGLDLTGAPPLVNDSIGRTMAYYDPMNYAPSIKCPVLMNAGLIDPVSPAFSVWAVYNRLGIKDKGIAPLRGLGHDWSAEFDRQAWRWLDSKLKK